MLGITLSQVQLTPTKSSVVLDPTRSMVMVAVTHSQGAAGADTIYAMDGTAEVQTIQVTNAAVAAETETVTILGRTVDTTFDATATVASDAGEIAASINADAVLGDLVTAVSDGR